MTEVSPDSLPEWKHTLETAASAAGHELRNALNGVVVNLEVVRVMTQAAGLSAEPFMGQARQQSEESVRLGEAVIALIRLLAAAIGPDGQLLCGSAGTNQVSLQAGADAERIHAALQPLSERGAVFVERSGSTVILRITQDSPDDTA